MNPQNPAILWDMDGTIFDSKACHYQTWKYTLNQFGFDFSQEDFDATFGRNNHATITLLLGFDPDPELFEDIVKIKEAYFRKLAPQATRLVPGVINWLTDARSFNLPQGLASSAPMENIQSLLVNFNLTEYFDQIVSGEHLPAKPEPDVFLKAAQALGRPPENCWVIEDSQPGVEAAKNAGMTCIAVTTNLPPTKLKSADLILEDFLKPLESVLKRFHVI